MFRTTILRLFTLSALISLSPAMAEAQKLKVFI